MENAIYSVSVGFLNRSKKNPDSPPPFIAKYSIYRAAPFLELSMTTAFCQKVKRSKMKMPQKTKDAWTVVFCRTLYKNHLWMDVAT